MYEGDSSAVGPNDEFASEFVNEVDVWAVPDPRPEDLWAGGDECPPVVDPELFSASELLAAACRASGVERVTLLGHVDPRALTADEAITLAQEWAKATAWVAGCSAAALAGVNDTVVAGRVADIREHVAEQGGAPVFRNPEPEAVVQLAVGLCASERAMAGVVQQAIDLAGPWRPLRDAMTAGQVPVPHAGAVMRALRELPGYGDPERTVEYAAHCARILKAVVPLAASRVPGRCAQRVRELAVVIDPAGARARRREAAESEHDVTLRPGWDSSSCVITAVLPVGYGEAVMSAVTGLSRHAGFEVGNQCVTAGQRRVSALVALVLGEPGTETTITGPIAAAKLRAQISVVVPVETLAAVTAQFTPSFDELQGGMVDGSPVPADVLADLLAACAQDSVMRRLLTDPAGRVVDAGRARYPVNAALRRLILARDRYCRFPGCHVRAERCEIDHATSWAAGGRTDADNLGPLCKHHHQLKTHCGWAIIASARDGTCTWRSPTGRIYHHTPPDLLPPKPERIPVPTGADDTPPF